MVGTLISGMPHKVSDYKLQFREIPHGNTIEEFVSERQSETVSRQEALERVLSRPAYMTLTTDDVEILTFAKVNEREERSTMSPVDESAFGF